MPQEAQVAPYMPCEACRPALAGPRPVADVVPPEVVGRHDLAEKENALPGVHGNDHHVFRKGEDLVEHIHHGTGEFIKPEAAQVVSCIGKHALSFDIRHASMQASYHIIVVEQLPQPHATVKQMAEDMHEDEDGVELQGRDAEPKRRIHTAKGMVPTEERLQAAVAQRGAEPGRPDVKLNGDAFTVEPVRMVVAYVRAGAGLAGKGNDVTPRAGKPDVDVAALAAQGGGGIEQRHSLALQNAGAEAPAGENGCYPCGVHVEFPVAGLRLAGEEDPSHDDVPRRPLAGRKPLDTGQADTGQGLLHGNVEEGLPLYG